MSNVPLKAQRIYYYSITDHQISIKYRPLLLFDEASHSVIRALHDIQELSPFAQAKPDRGTPHRAVICWRMHIIRRRVLHLRRAAGRHSLYRRAKRIWNIGGIATGLRHPSNHTRRHSRRGSVPRRVGVSLLLLMLRVLEVLARVVADGRHCSRRRARHAVRMLLRLVLAGHARVRLVRVRLVLLLHLLHCMRHA